MKNKFKKKMLFTSLGLMSIMTLSGIVLPIVSCSNNSTPSKTDEKFTSNIDEIRKKITNTPTRVFDPAKADPNWKPWNKLDDNANNPIYRSIFNRINEQLITNDLYLFIVDLASDNKEFASIYVENFVVKKKNNKYVTDIKLKVKNTNSYERIFKIFLWNKNITINSNEIKEINISFNTNIKYEFFKRVTNSANYQYILRANYSFNEVMLNNEKLTNVKLANYSLSLNTVVNNVVIATEYDDLENKGNQYLAGLTINQIQSDIEKRILTNLMFIKTNANDIQLVLQAIAANQRLKDFISSNSVSLTNIIVNALAIRTIDLNELKPLIVDVLQDRTIIEILNDQKNKSAIDAMIRLVPESFKTIVEMLIQNLSSEKGIDELVQSLNQEPFLTILGSDFINSLTNLKTMGTLTFIFSNVDAIINLLLRLNIIDHHFVQQYLGLIKLIAGFYLGNSKGILQDLVDIILFKQDPNDPNSAYVFEKILEKLILNPNLLSVIKQLFYNNENFNATNLAKFIGVIANPYTDDTVTTVMNYSEWFNSLTITSIFDKNNSYNNQTYVANIKYNFKILITKNIYFKIEDLYAILPNNLTVNNTVIPVSLIKSLLPRQIALKQNDYVEYIQNNQNTTINYDVIKQNNHNYLTWNMLSNNTVNVNLPQSLETICKTSSVPSKTLATALNNVFYYQAQNYHIFYPAINSTNPTIKNYDYLSYNNQAILTKALNETQIQTIKQAILAKTTTKPVMPLEQYQWSSLLSKITLTKNITHSEFMLDTNINSTTPVINELFDFSNMKSNYTYKLEINHFITETSLLGFKVPPVYSIKIKVFANKKFYSNNSGLPTQEIEISL